MGPPSLARPEMIAHSSTMISTPRVKPAIGELIIGMKTFHSRPLFLVHSPTDSDQIRASQLLCAAANAAPHNPPISACEDEDGNPRHQVNRFQTMAPPSAHRITCEVTLTTSVSINPEAIVLATAVPQKAPIRFITAARITACPGDNTLVATTVAIELAVSWKPLMNSNTSAARITTSRRVNIDATSAVLQGDLVGDDAGLAATVDRLLQDLEELLEQEHLAGIEAAGIDVAVQFQDQPVGLGLEHAQAVVERLHRFQPQVRQFLDHLDDHAGSLFQHRRARGEIDPFEAVSGQRIAVGEALDLLGDLVQRRPQRFDVLALDRGDEAVDQRLADLVGGDAFALPGELEGVQARGAIRRLEHFVQGLGAVVCGFRGIVEQRVELLALAEDRLQGEHRGWPRRSGVVSGAGL